MNDRKVTVNLTNRTILRAILWVVVTVMAFRFVGRISHILTLIFVAFFLAMALNPGVSALSRHLRIRSRGAATSLAYLIVIALLSLLVVFTVPPLVRQTREFIASVPGTVQDFQNQNSKLAQASRRYHLDQKITQSAKDFASHYNNIGSTIFDTGKRIIEVFASVVAVLVMAFMMLVEGPRWLELFWGVMPPRHRQRHKRMAHKMYRGVTGFVNGQVVLAIAAATFSFITLEVTSHIFNASVNSAALAGIVFMFGLIPLFGNPMASIIVVLACLINSVSLGLFMLAYFVVYFFIENHTFQPYIQSRLNDLTPLTVFIAAILGVGFAGFLGAILAIPFASAAKIIVEDYFERRGHQPAPTKGL